MACALLVTLITAATASGQELAASEPTRAGDVSEVTHAQLNEVDVFERDITPLLENHCVECHNEDESSGGVDLTPFYDLTTALEGGRLWVKVLDVVESGAMPPSGSIRPSQEETDRLVTWVQEDFFRKLHEQNPDPTAVVVRRLNRQEYDNTIRDLTGLRLELAADFPADDSGFGYDNIGSALSLSPVHIEKYLKAADRVARAAISVPDAANHSPVELIGLRTYPLRASEPVEFEHQLRPGRYLVDFSLVRVGVDDTVEPPWLIIGLGADRRRVTATRIQDETLVYRLWLRVGEGEKTARIELAPESFDQTALAKSASSNTNDSGDQRYGNNRGLHVDSMVVRGPVKPPRRSDAGVAIGGRMDLPELEGIGSLQCRQVSCEPLIGRFAERAFRRPLKAGELSKLLELFQLADSRGESMERSIQVALTSILVSPQFLFLVEPETSRANRPLDDYELATRLSYFLWSSTPDESLMEEAKNGTLNANLAKQVERMLQDPKASALVENFVGQWLQLRDLGSVSRDEELFPAFDDVLRESMIQETEEFFTFLIRQNRSALELLDADYTFVNDKLASHYGMSGVRGGEFRMIKLTDRSRGGVLTQASVLTLTSNPNRTSPVKRGQWILQQILGSPPPPPPPDVAELDESPQATDAASLRERMELHRANPECAACHQQMDAIGFAFENYDAVGKWRSEDHGFPIDSAGQLSGGAEFANAAELKSHLASEASKKFTRCLIENMLTYALGRSLEPNDYLTVETIRRNLEARDFGMQDLIKGIVQSETFRSRGVSK